MALVTLVTGVSSGFGQMIARDLACAGHTVFASMPGTEAGTPAIRQLIEDGLNIGSDRLFVHFVLDGDTDLAADAKLKVLASEGAPVVTIRVGKPGLVGQEFVRWEIATAVAGAVIGIDPFDQPDVEEAKIATRKLVDAYEESGSLEPETPVGETADFALFAGKGARRPHWKMSPPSWRAPASSGLCCLPATRPRASRPSTCSARHVQLVLTDRSALTAGRDYGVLSARTWRLADLSAKQSMLLAGLGWGNMPFHMVEDDIERGRLKVIRPADFDPRVARLVMGCAYLTADQLGPGARWLVERLRAGPGPHFNEADRHAAQTSGG
jgi:hypothetical protein